MAIGYWLLAIGYWRRRVIKLFSLFCIECTCSIKKFAFSVEIKRLSEEISKMVSTSNTEPIDIAKKRAKSFSFFRDAPSAMFSFIEIGARYNCDVSPNLSSAGKLAVSSYIKLTNSRQSYQTPNSLKFLILLCFLI